MQTPTGFLGSLFDLSFTSFITTKLIKVLYGLWLAVAGLAALVLIISGFQGGAGRGVLMLIIGAPLLFFFSALYGRVLMEITIVVFRIAEHTAEIAEQGRRTPTSDLIAGD